jgi:hypothetical protein
MNSYERYHTNFGVYFVDKEMTIINLSVLVFLLLATTCRMICMMVCHMWRFSCVCVVEENDFGLKVKRSRSGV